MGLGLGLGLFNCIVGPVKTFTAKYENGYLIQMECHNTTHTLPLISSMSGWCVHGDPEASQWKLAHKTSHPIDGLITTLTHMLTLQLSTPEAVNTFSTQVTQFSIKYLVLCLHLTHASEGVIFSRPYPIHVEWLFDKSKDTNCYYLYLLSISALQKVLFFKLLNYIFKVGPSASSVTSALCWQEVDRQRSYK